MGARRQPGSPPAAARQRQAALFRARDGAGRAASRRPGQRALRCLRRGGARRHHLCVRTGRIHASGHLQPRQPRQAGLHDRGAPGAAGRGAAAPGPARRGRAAMSRPDSAELVIDVHGLNKHFGDKHVVNDVSLQVRRGEIYGFLGPNGSGKTTCIRLMCGLLTPDSGSGTCLGYDIRTQSADIKRHVGYMTQKFSYWEDLTIRENLDFVARMYEMPDRRQVVEQALEGLGLQSRADQLTGALSGGWKQRLALAACLLHEPQLLLLDEPTAGV